MLETPSTEPYVHHLDGLPDERALKRVRARSLTLRNPVPGTVIDLTIEGLGIECTQPLRVFDRYSFTIVAETCRIHKRGEVRWSRLTTAGVGPSGVPETVYRVGIAFL